MFFVMFKRLAEARSWSDNVHTLLLQCILKGKAQEAYSSLNSPDSTKYLSVKATVLKVYELVPEAYRQRFRSWRKSDKSHLKFASDLCTHFDRWCGTAEAGSYETFREFIILEQFKNSVPECIATYISEQKVKMSV